MADPVHLEQNQEFTATLTNVKDGQGRDTTFDGIPTWETSDATIGDLRVAADGLSAIVGSLAVDGGVTITVTGDARMGEEVVPVMGVLSVIVAPGDVAIFDFVAGPAGPRTA